MALVVVVLVGAVALGRVLGGSLGRLGALPVHRRRYVAVALAAQLLAALASPLAGWVYPAGLALSAAAVVAFLDPNRRLEGVPLIAAGLLLNAAVVAANGAMPVSRSAAARAGVAEPLAGDAGDPRHTVATATTVLRPLGDVVPVPLPWRPEVASPGDVLLTAGVALLVLRGMLETPTTERGSDGEEGPQAARPQEQEGQPRSAAERLRTRAPLRR